MAGKKAVASAVDGAVDGQESAYLTSDNPKVEGMPFQKVKTITTKVVTICGKDVNVPANYGSVKGKDCYWYDDSWTPEASIQNPNPKPIVRFAFISGSKIERLSLGKATRILAQVENIKRFVADMEIHKF